MIAKIAVSAANFAIDKPYSYFVPRGMTLEPGIRVIVSFGRGNRKAKGVVLSLEEGDETGLKAVEEKFGKWLPGLKWVNFGGGHHVTRDDYDIALLENCIRHVQDTYGAQVYLEPGEAVALNAGFLVTTVLEVMENGMQIAILDTSAACHMPDVLEMPYRPPLKESGEAGEKPYTYRLAGPTCLAGDVIGDYSFEKPLRVGERLVFGDMAIYSMVKNNTFNGMALPTIVLQRENGECEIMRKPSYEDFKSRLS